MSVFSLVKWLVGKTYYKLDLGMWQMISFKDLCLEELELLGQVAKARH